MCVCFSKEDLRVLKWWVGGAGERQRKTESQGHHAREDRHKSIKRNKRTETDRK